MKRRGLLAILVLLLLSGVLAPAPRVQANPTVHYVAPVGTNCWGATPCYTEVSRAVEALPNHGGEVRIAAGVYTDNRDARRVPSAYPGNKKFRVTIEASEGAVIYVTGGYGSGDWTTPQPELHPTYIIAGWERNARAAYVNEAVLYLAHLTVSGIAEGLGGAPGWVDAGGALYVWSGELHLENVIIQDSFAQIGGGIYANPPAAASVWLNRVTFRGNQGDTCAAGYIPDLRWMTGSLLHDNAGPLCVEQGLIGNSTLVNNHGGGLHVDSVDCYNLQITHHTGNNAPALQGTVETSVRYVNFYANTVDMAGIQPAQRYQLTYQNPHYADPNAHDYRLTSASPRDDGETRTGGGPPDFPNPQLDRAGELRPVNGAYDRGAFEYPYGIAFTPAKGEAVVYPGDALQVQRHLGNPGNYPDTYTGALMFDESWDWHLPAPVTLDARESQPVIVTGSVPAAALYQTTASLTWAYVSANEPLLQATTMQTYHVGLVGGLTLSSATGHGAPGALVTTMHQATNTANTAQALALSGSGPLAATISPLNTGSLAPWNGMATVTVQATLPSDALAGETYTLQMQGTGSVVGSATATSVLTVDLVGAVQSAPATAHGAPGALVTLTHPVTNTANTTQTVSLALSGPLAASVSPTSLHLPPRSAGSVTVQATLPADALAGETYALTLHATGNAIGSATKTGVLSTDYVAGVAWDAAPPPAVLRPGDTATLTRTLHNTGNGPETFALTATPPAGWTLTQPLTLTLPARGQAVVTVTVQVPETAPTGTLSIPLTAATTEVSATVGLAFEITAAEPGDPEEPGPSDPEEPEEPAGPTTLYLPLVASAYARRISVPEVGDTPDTAWEVAVGPDYTARFDHANDNDWFVFTATAGATYRLRTLELGPNCDTVLYLYDFTGLQLLAQNDDRAPGNPASEIVWTATYSGLHRILVRHYDWRSYGAGTDYTLRVTELP